MSVGQPTDVVKIRLQAQGATGHKHYSGSLHAYSNITKTEGIRGLWKGMSFFHLFFAFFSLRLLRLDHFTSFIPFVAVAFCINCKTKEKYGYEKENIVLMNLK